MTTHSEHAPTARVPGASAADHGAMTWLLAIAVLSFVAGRCLVPMDETDLFYNLRLGEIVLTTQAVPHTNLLSFTAPDYPDPNLAWLFQVVLALAHRAGGVAGTVLLKTAFVVATFALLVRVAIRRGAHPAVTAAAMALAAWTAEPRFVERPHLVTFLGLAILLLALERAEDRRPRLLWAMIPLGLIWANGNSCFFLAPSVLILYTAGAWMDARTPSARRTALRTGAVALLLVPLLFATPSGSGWMGYVANHWRMPWLRPLQEYRPAEWPLDGPFIFLLFAVALATILGARASSESSMRHLLPLLALAVVGSRRIRFVAEFALLAAPYASERASVWLRSTMATKEAKEAKEDGRVRPAKTSRLLRTGSWVVAGVIVLLTFGPRVRAAVSTGRPFLDLGIEEGLIPEPAIHWLDAHDLRDRLYNDLEVGSYLAWDGWPRHRVFQDPRINAYPPEMHAILRRQDLDRATWDRLMDRFDIQAALITYPDVNPRATLFDPDRWALCYRSVEGLVFVRRTDRWRELIAAEELPLTFRFDRITGVSTAPVEVAPRLSPVRACEWSRRLAEWYATRDAPAPTLAAAAYRAVLSAGPECLAPALREPTREQAAILALRLGEPERAAGLLEGIFTPSARTNRGFALIQLRRPQDALREFEEALRVGASSEPEASFGRGLALQRLGRIDEAATALGAFVARWPSHLAAREARAMLEGLHPPAGGVPR